MEKLLNNPPVVFCPSDKVYSKYPDRIILWDKFTNSSVEILGRFGSLSQNALVYKVRSGDIKYIVKTTPIIGTSVSGKDKELEFAKLFSNVILNNHNQHFPILYWSFLCANVGYTGNVSLYRKFFDDMHEKNILPIKEFLIYYSYLVATPQYNRLIHMGRLSQAWKILSPSITNEHLTDYFIEKKLGDNFLSRIYSVEMAEMDLRMYLQNHVMVWPIMKQICETLEFIYNLGFHHNDVHPGNILLMNTDEEPFVLLWDFEKMATRNHDEELFDLISLCNSFTYTIAEALVSATPIADTPASATPIVDAPWDEKSISLIQQILSKGITTWKDVNSFILKNHQHQLRQHTTPDNT